MNEQAERSDRASGTPRWEAETSPEEDLAMIRRMMRESREVTDAGAPHLVLWGVAVLAGLVANYLYVGGAMAVNPGIVWITVIGLGWVGSFWLGRRRDREMPVRTIGGRVMTGIWAGGGVTMTILGVVPPALGVVGSSGGIMGPIALVLGGCYFASSFVYRSRAMRWMSVAWWLGGAAMMQWSGSTSMLIMGCLVLFLQVIPGLWLVRRTADRGSAAVT